MATSETNKTARPKAAVPTRRGVGDFLLDQRAFVVLIILVIVFSMLSDSYLTQSNLISMTKNVVYNALLAMGMLLVVITGGIDLSVGSIIGITSVTAGALLEGWGLSLFDTAA